MAAVVLPFMQWLMAHDKVTEPKISGAEVSDKIDGNYCSK